MSKSFRKPLPSSPEACPGIRDFLRPTMKYVKCHTCNMDVEIWSDEDTGVCQDCGAEWKKPEDDASCLEYCEYSGKCQELISSSRKVGK